MTDQSGMDTETLSMVLDTIDKLERDRLSLETKLEMDREGEFPMELIRFMLGPDMALHLIFVPEEYSFFSDDGRTALSDVVKARCIRAGEKCLYDDHG